MLLSSIRERRQEIQLLRAVGAPPGFLFLLIELEALFIAISSIVLASLLLTACLIFSQDYLVSHFGLHIKTNIFSQSSLYLIAAMLIASMLVAVIPSLSMYLQSKGKSE